MTAITPAGFPPGFLVVEEIPLKISRAQVFNCLDPPGTLF